jgi:hypothetical protein
MICVGSVAYRVGHDAKIRMAHAGVSADIILALAMNREWDCLQIDQDLISTRLRYVKLYDFC